MQVRTIHDVASLVRGRRRDLGWSQAELARRVGRSRKWIGEVEAAKGSVELGGVLAVLDALGVQLTDRAADETPLAARPGEPPVDLDELLDGYR